MSTNGLDPYLDIINASAQALQKAVIIKSSKVGCAVKMKDGTIFQGFNVESRGYPIIHAEISAVLSAIRAGYNKNDYEAISIAYEVSGNYPACACCRQFLWEHTNPNLVVISVCLEDKSINGYILSSLYPLPFPVEQTKATVSKELILDVADKEVKEDSNGK
jgi:cytidine deaminase